MKKFVLFLAVMALGSFAYADTFTVLGLQAAYRYGATLGTIDGRPLTVYSETAGANSVVVMDHGLTGHTLLSVGSDSAVGCLAVYWSDSVGGVVVDLGDSTGYNGNAGTLLKAVPTVRLDSLDGMNPTQNVVMTDGESATGWTVNTGLSAVTASTSTFKRGSKSLKLVFGDATTSTAATSPAITFDGTGDEYIYVWVNSSAALLEGNLKMVLDDDDASTDPVINFPSIPTANKWQLCRLDISGVSAGDKDVVTAFKVKSGSATALDGVTVYIDQAVKVDGAEVGSLNFDAVDQPDAARSVLAVAKGEASAHTMTKLDLTTDYDIDYVNDKVIFYSDQSANTLLLLYASAD